MSYPKPFYGLFSVNGKPHINRVADGRNVSLQVCLPDNEVGKECEDFARAHKSSGATSCSIEKVDGDELTIRLYGEKCSRDFTITQVGDWVVRENVGSCFPYECWVDYPNCCASSPFPVED